MTRILNLGVAQLGPIARDESRSSAVRRMIELMEQAHEKKVELIVFPELALTTFFPRWYLEDPDELEAFFETEMPNQTTQPLFDAAARMGIGFYLGYAELCVENGQRHQFNKHPSAAPVPRPGSRSQYRVLLVNLLKRTRSACL